MTLTLKRILVDTKLAQVILALSLCLHRTTYARDHTEPTRKFRVAYISTLTELAEEHLADWSFEAHKQRFLKGIAFSDEQMRRFSMHKNYARASDFGGNAFLVNELLENHPHIEVALIIFDNLGWQHSEIPMLANHSSLSKVAPPVVLHPASWKTLAKNSSERAVAKAQYERHILDLIDQHHIDLLVSDRAMFYFGVIPDEHSGFSNRIYNNHPGDLLHEPPFLGKEPVKDALNAFQQGTAQYTGLTFHRVTKDVDGGEKLLFTPVAIYSDDNEAKLTARMYAFRDAQHQIAAIEQLVARLGMVDYHVPEDLSANSDFLNPAWLKRLYDAVGIHINASSCFQVLQRPSGRRN